MDSKPPRRRIRIKRIRRRKRKRKSSCSICKREGHNIRTCPKAKMVKARMRKFSKKKLTADEDTSQIETKCSICLDDINDDTQTLSKCGHQFHLECLSRGKVDFCPNCRITVTPEELGLITGGEGVVLSQQLIDDVLQEAVTELHDFDELHDFEWYSLGWDEGLREGRVLHAGYVEVLEQRNSRMQDTISTLRQQLRQHDA